MTTSDRAFTPLTLTLFGPMQVLVQGQHLPPLRSRKALWLLALLTLRHDRPVEREWLAGTLWPDVDQRQAFANLRPVVSELRRALGSQGERLRSPDSHTLRLDLTGAEVDVLTFDAAMENRKLPAMEQAVALYCGPLLEGCAEEWVFQEREQREQSCIHALLKLGDSTQATGDYEAAIRFYQRAADLDPWSDSPRRGWMEALAKRGDVNGALHVYREFVDLLRDDPTVVPDEQTTALYTRLRSEARQRVGTHARVAEPRHAVPAVTGRLPHPLSELVGREEERQEVALLLRRSRLVTLTGVGGIGKTRLAVAVAHQVVEDFPDGVFLISLEVLTAGDQVIPHAASVLGLMQEPNRPFIETLLDHLRERQLLLVLDNCEHLREMSAHLAAGLLTECARLRVLATSREALGVVGETVWSVPSLAVPDPLHLPTGRITLQRVLMAYEGIQLFLERAQAVQRSFQLTASNAQLVAEICSRLEGIPLAIELAAAHVKAMSIERIARLLNNELELLTQRSPTALTRQQTLRATLDWSYDLLTDAERSMLRRLSIFAGGWTQEAAEAVCKDEVSSRKGDDYPLRPSSSILRSSDVDDLLTSLVDKSLVVFEEREQGTAGRYRLLEMVRQYAAERLQASGEMERVRAKHRDWCVALAEEAEPALVGAEQQVWAQRLAAEYDNFRNALQNCGTDPPEASAGLRITGALWRFWYIRAMYVEGSEHLLRALANDKEPSPTVERGKALHGAGVLSFRMSAYSSARKLLEEALSIRERIGDRRGVGDSLMILGNVAFDLGDYSSGRAFYERSKCVRQEIGDTRGTAILLGNLGNYAINRCDLAEARTLYEESLGLLREVGDEFQIAWALDNLAVIAATQGNYATAQAYLDESLPIFEKLGERRGIAWSLHRMGAIDQDRGRYESAVDRLQQSAALFKELEDRRGMASSYHQLGMIALDQKDSEAARNWLSEGFRLFDEMENKHGIAHFHRGMGLLLHAQGNLEAAYTAFDESLRMFRDLGEKKGVADSLNGRAALMMAKSQGAEAVVLLAAVESIRASTGVYVPLRMQEEQNALKSCARSSLGEAAFASAWEEGCGLTWEKAVAYALEEPR